MRDSNPGLKTEPGQIHLFEQQHGADLQFLHPLLQEAPMHRPLDLPWHILE